jgi:hypothetical protein
MAIKPFAKATDAARSNTERQNAFAPISTKLRDMVNLDLYKFRQHFQKHVRMILKNKAQLKFSQFSHACLFRGGGGRKLNSANDASS